MPDASVVAAVPEITQDGRHGVEDSASSVIADVVKQALAESDAIGAGADTETARGPDGRFLPKATPEGEQATPASEVAPPVGVEGEPVPEVAAEPVFPEGFVPVPKVEGRELATPFTVMDKDGDLETPDIRIKYQANGKERVDPIDKVVKLAQMGVYNEQRELQVQQSREAVQAAEQREQQIRDYAIRLERERTQLLSDENLYISTRAQYEQQNTPEARNQQLQQQIVQQNQQAEFVQAAQQGQQFFASELEPAVDQILAALPTVNPVEIGAKMLLISNRFMVHTPLGSIVPPRAYPAFRQAVAEEVLPWAQQLHEQRESDRKASTQKTDAEKLALQKVADTARVDAQKSKTLVGKVGKPGSGRAGATTPAPKVIKTVQDAEESVLDSTMAAMGFAKAG